MTVHLARPKSAALLEVLFLFVQMFCRLGVFVSLLDIVHVKTMSQFLVYIISLIACHNLLFLGAVHHKDLASQHQLSDRSNMPGHFKRPVVSSEMPRPPSALCSLGEECKNHLMCHSGQLL